MNKIRLITVCLAVLVAGACSAAATFFRFDSGETFTADKSYFSERRHTTTAPVSADMADIRAMVTLTSMPEFAASVSLKDVMKRALGPRGEDVERHLIRACAAAQTFRMAGSAIETETSLSDLEARLQAPSAGKNFPWPEITAAQRFEFLAATPRFNGSAYHLKLIYELGSDTKDELAYDRDYALMFMPIFNITSLDKSEYLADVLSLRGSPQTHAAFVRKWIDRTPLHSAKVSCAAMREPAGDWVWFQLRLGVVNGELQTSFMAQTVSTPSGDEQKVRVAIVSYPELDDRLIPNTSMTVTRSARDAFTCSQCHRRTSRYHTVRDQDDPTDRKLDHLGLMTFFAQISANTRNPAMGPMKSRFQNTWEEYHLQLLRKLAGERSARVTAN